LTIISVIMSGIRNLQWTVFALFGYYGEFIGVISF